MTPKNLFPLLPRSPGKSVPLTLGQIEFLQSLTDAQKRRRALRKSKK